MKMKFGIKEVVATGIGTALFVALTEVQIPLGFIPNTALQPRAALLAFLAAVFGPVVGGIVGLLGHAIGDALFYGSVRTADSRRNRSCCSTLCRLLPTSLHG